MNKKNIYIKLIDNKVFISIVGVILLMLVFYILFYRKKTSIAEKRVLDKGIDDEEQKGNVASYSDVEFIGMAEIIENALARYSAFDDKPEEAVKVLKKMKNDTDVLKLIKAYGKRQPLNFGIPIGSPTSLPTLINDELDTDEIADVNNDYSKKLIKYSWK